MSSPASSQPKKPKGILKKPAAASSVSTAPAAPISPFPVEEHKPASSRKPTAREVAIQQALVIQQQRELEDRIQDSIIELARLPLAPSPSSSSSNTTTTLPTYDASNPSPTDADSFRAQVRLFQPSDYEDLIIERNTLGKCGYTLCPKPRIKLGKGGEYKIIGWGTRDFNIVPRKELERWCSQQCARRAMYVKVQLLETAAAERAGIPSIKIELLDEPKQVKRDDEAVKRVAKELQDLEIDKEEKAARDAGILALERGDAKERPATKPVTLTIREKSVTTAAQEPSLDNDGEDHLVLEGYKTTFDPKTHDEQD
ncbi:Rtr1/RPAP2 family-domain-containing protein [Hypoxylon sp. FL0890]|nr:Rtr1/RPAP2 family-domain-containing protein [Hypoxylon sp. FL0890]